MCKKTKKETCSTCDTTRNNCVSQMWAHLCFWGIIPENKSKLFREPIINPWFRHNFHHTTRATQITAQLESTFQQNTIQIPVTRDYATK